MHGPTCIFWANLTPCSLKWMLDPRLRAPLSDAMGGDEPEGIKSYWWFKARHGPQSPFDAAHYLISDLPYKICYTQEASEWLYFPWRIQGAAGLHQRALRRHRAAGQRSRGP